MELDHECWAIVTTFLTWCGWKALLALNKRAVDLSMHRQFFQRSAWRATNSSTGRAGAQDDGDEEKYHAAPRPGEWQ